MSNRIGFSEVILSAFFFLVAVFTICTVLLTFVFNDFSGLFLLVSGVGGVYANFYLALGVAGVLSVMGIMIKERTYRRMRIHYFLFCYFMLLVFVVNILMGLSAVVLSVSEVQALDSLLFSIFINGTVIDCAFFFFFVALPFMYYYASEEVSLYKKFYLFPHVFVPSPNVMMVVLFSFAIQPLNKDYWWEWWEISIAFIGICMVLYLFFMRRFLFASYEKFNLILLLIGVVVFVISHSVFESYANQYAAKKTIYLLAVWGWALGVLDKYKIEFTKRMPLINT